MQLRAQYEGSAQKERHAFVERPRKYCKLFVDLDFQWNVIDKGRAHEAGDFIPVLIRECGDPEFLISSLVPSPIKLPRRGTSGVTGKNPSSSSPIPFPKDDKFGSKSYIND